MQFPMTSSDPERSLYHQKSSHFKRLEAVCVWVWRCVLSNYYRSAIQGCLKSRVLRMHMQSWKWYKTDKGDRKWLCDLLNYAMQWTWKVVRFQVYDRNSEFRSYVFRFRVFGSGTS